MNRIRQTTTAVVMRGLGVATLLVALGGCTVFPEREARRMFTLAEPVIEASSGTASELTLRVDTPAAPAPLDTSRIVVLRDEGELALYGNSRWRDHGPALVRDQLVEGFRQDGRLAAVVTEQSRARSDRSLIGELGRFQMVAPTDGRNRVQIRLDVQLVDDRSRQTLATRRFEVEEPADDQRVEAAVAAFGRASQALVEQVVEWTLTVDSAVNQ